MQYHEADRKHWIDFVTPQETSSIIQNIHRNGNIITNVQELLSCKYEHLSNENLQQHMKSTEVPVVLDCPEIHEVLNSHAQQTLELLQESTQSHITSIGLPFVLLHQACNQIIISSLSGIRNKGPSIEVSVEIPTNWKRVTKSKNFSLKSMWERKALLQALEHRYNLQKFKETKAYKKRIDDGRFSPQERILYEKLLKSWILEKYWEIIKIQGIRIKTCPRDEKERLSLELNGKKTTLLIDKEIPVNFWRTYIRNIHDTIRLALNKVCEFLWVPHLSVEEKNFVIERYGNKNLY